jgi:hypothetical protein
MEMKNVSVVNVECRPEIRPEHAVLSLHAFFPYTNSNRSYRIEVNDF